MTGKVKAHYGQVLYVAVVPSISHTYIHTLHHYGHRKEMEYQAQLREQVEEKRRKKEKEKQIEDEEKQRNKASKQPNLWRVPSLHQVESFSTTCSITKFRTSEVVFRNI